MTTTTVYPFCVWHENQPKFLPHRLATLEWIDRHQAFAADQDRPQKVDSERVFDGQYIPKEYRDYILIPEEGSPAWRIRAVCRADVPRLCSGLYENLFRAYDDIRTLIDKALAG